MTGTVRETFDAYLRDVRSRGDFSRWFAPDVRWTTMETGEQVRGREAVRDLIVFFHSTAFDAQVEFVHGVVDGSTAVVEAVFAATHTGEFAGIPATGARVRLPYTVAYDIADGLITELRAYLSIAALREQLSAAVPAQPAHA
jgi:predicted ester cyclase